MRKILFLMSFLSLSAYAIQPRDKVDVSELPDAICKVRFANLVGISTRHCNATFISPTQALIPQSCYPFSGGGVRGVKPKVSCRKGPELKYANVPELTIEKEVSHPGFAAATSSERPMNDYRMITVSPAVKFQVMEPVLDPVQAEEILKQTPDDKCFVAGFGGQGGFYNRRTIPRRERQLVHRKEGDEVQIKNAYELNDTGSPLYCQVDGKLWMLGFLNAADRGFSSDKVNYIPTLTPAADWIRKNVESN